MGKQKASTSEIAKKSLKIKDKMANLQQEYNLINNVKVTEFRFGNFKVRLSDMKVDIAPVATAENKGNILSMHTYRLGSDVFLAFYMALSKFKLNPDTKIVNLEKTEDEIADGHRMVTYYINSLYHLSMFLTDSQFANEYIQLVSKTLEAKAPKEITKEQDDEILREMEMVDEAQKIVGEGVE